MLQTLNQLSRNHKLVLYLSMAVGITARLISARIGSNYDFGSYLVVVEAKAEGLSPWETNRYNYGPVWALLLYLFEWSSSILGRGFRLQIVILLTLADLCIAGYLLRIKGALIAAAFFLNPVSVIITGFHNQFDNLAIALVSIGCALSGDRTRGSIVTKDIVFMSLLGLSLTTKHIFLFFVVWTAIRQEERRRAIFFALGPILIFVASFVPFLGSSRDAIWSNVVAYRGFQNAPMWTLVGLEQGLGPLSVTVLFTIGLMAGGFLMRGRSLSESLLIYTVLVVTFSPAIANQYLVIPMVGIFGLWSVAYSPYIIYATYWLLIDLDGLNLDDSATGHFGASLNVGPVRSLALEYGHQVSVAVLGIGLLYTLWRDIRVHLLHDRRGAKNKKQ